MNAAERSGPSPGLTLDDLLGGRITIAQPARGYRAGSDALLLAAAVPARPGERIFEAGIGTGAAALALLARVNGCRVTGVENESAHAELARRNADDNGYGEQIELVQCDIAEATVDALRSRRIASGFHHAMANPPFYEEGRARAPESASRAAAHVCAPGALAVWVARLADATAGGGTVTMIHRAAMLDEAVAALARHLGNITILPLAAHEGDDAARVIVQARKGARSGPRLMAPLVLHHADGSPTPAADAVLRGGAALDLSTSPVSIVKATVEV